MTRTSRWSFLAFSLLAALVCTRLGLWQLSRLRERRAHNQQVLAARTLPAVNLSDASAVAAVPAGGWADRRVSASGSYDFGTQFVIRRQALNGTPGVRVVTPLRPDSGDSAVLVIRGFVASPDAGTVALDSLMEKGTQRVEGIAVPLTTSPSGGESLEHDHQLTSGPASGTRCEPSRSCRCRTPPCPSLPPDWSRCRWMTGRISVMRCNGSDSRSSRSSAGW